MDFTIPEDLGTLSADDLAALIGVGDGLLDDLFALTDPTDDDYATAKQISEAIASLHAESAARTTAVADRQASMAALREARVTAQVVEDEDDEDDDEDDEDDSAEALAMKKKKKKAACAPDETPVESAVEPVVAAVSTRAAVAARTKRPLLPASATQTYSPVVITAAADVPNIATGKNLSMDEVGQGIIERTQTFGVPTGNGLVTDIRRYGVAKFAKQFRPEQITTGSADDQEKIDAVANERNLPGQSLVAAGGWCAPSETMYDLCEGETTDGMVSIPEVQVNRGGIRYTRGIDYSVLYTANGFTQTEAQAVAGTVKPCYEVPCPTFVDVRMDVIGLCIKIPILTNVGYPELVRRVTNGVLIAHQHRVNAYVIGKMVTAAGVALAPATVGGSTNTALDALELQAEWLRGVYRLSLSQTMEVVLPYWTRAVMRGDLANRNGVDHMAVSDQQLAGYFAARKLNVQWVYDWQDIPTPDVATYPTTFQALIYPAGTFVKGTSSVISLDAIYDAASLATNVYTGTFTEEGILVTSRCYQAKLVTIATCLAGITGANTNTNCLASP